MQTFNIDYLKQLVDGDRAKYYQASGTARPAEGVRDGSLLVEVDTENEYTFYGGRWHLTKLGTPTTFTFTVTFDKGTASAVSEATREVTYDEAYGELPTTTPAAGYELEGWYLDEEFTQPVEADDIVTIEADATLYAKHVPIVYPITYDLDDGENDPANPASFTVVTPTITLEPAIKVGYTFGGWYTESAFTNAVTEIALGSHEAITLYARFTAIEYDITYNLDGGTNGANPATYNIETPTIVLADATKEGYTFDGWYEEDTFTTAVTEIALGSTGDVTLYAKFTAVEG